MYYCQTVFGKGAGLGNRLFPWARCRIFSSVNNIQMLSPQWVTGRIGPLLRGGIDLRCYKNQILLMDLFKKKEGDIGGIHKMLLQAMANKEIETDNFELIQTQPPTQDVIITFQGNKNYFEDLYGWEELIFKELQAITKFKWLKLVEFWQDIPIAINVRLGNDFNKAKSVDDFYTKGSLKTPIEWFIESLLLIRETLGFSAKAFVVSDGKEEDLKPLLSLENVTHIRPGCAISDLLVLSKAKILIASGGSSFSAWASFLGQMPTISHPGQSLSWFKINNRKGYYVGEFSPTSPAQPLIESVKLCLLPPTT
ncbi:MAG: hypothetical protein DSM106950_21300 [Stigonema ocellatum SAG 48.90 = DSM 106950]|nr:hypothetical protein [Stigonema ocellatum SAG 48.90 = DSM 106950]